MVPKADNPGQAQTGGYLQDRLAGLFDHEIL